MTNTNSFYTFRPPVFWFATFVVFLPVFAVADLFVDRGETVPPKSADTGESATRKYAVLIGIDNYDSLPKLDGCKSDVKLLSEALLRCGFKKNDIKTLTEKPTKNAIQKTLEELAESISNAEMIIVYFSGHAGTFDGIPMLAPMDFDIKRPMTTGLPLDDLITSLKRCKVDSRLLLLDAMPFYETSRDAILSGEFSNRKEQMVLPPRTALFCAAKPGLKAFGSLELGCSGIFTHHLVNGLLGEADKRGDSNGIVDLAELYLYVKSQVARDSLQKMKKLMVPGLIVSNDIDDIFNLEIVTIPSVKSNEQPPRVRDALLHQRTTDTPTAKMKLSSEELL
jgi:hypothetical protein